MKKNKMKNKMKNKKTQLANKKDTKIKPMRKSIRLRRNVKGGTDKTEKDGDKMVEKSGMKDILLIK